jgi:radical SAM protein with 4Fe4S-binding SPASM domain
MGLCEPLLNPHVGEILEKLNDCGYESSITTNGMVNVDNVAKQMCLTGAISVSLDTFDAATLKHQRGGADLETIIHNLERLLLEKKKGGGGLWDKPIIYVTSVMTTHNFGQFPQLVKMLEKYSNQLSLLVDPVTRTDYQHFEQPFVLADKRFRDLIPEYREIERNSPLKIVGLDWMFEPSVYQKDCIMPWNSMFLQPNGDIFSCYHYGLVFGNVFQRSPLATWNNESARHFRHQLRTGTNTLKQCVTCNWARKGWQPGGTYLKERKDVGE